MTLVWTALAFVLGLVLVLGCWVLARRGLAGARRFVRSFWPHS
ncbi:MAG: hypothetical protein ABI051_07630 [Vicinamibacterales bacterium]